MVAVVAVCRYVRACFLSQYSYPYGVLRGWYGGCPYGAQPADVDGINAENGLYRLVFNFSLAKEKIILCSVLGFGSAVNVATSVNIYHTGDFVSSIVIL